jgi:hypothetical protein
MATIRAPHETKLGGPRDFKTVRVRFQDSSSIHLERILARVLADPEMNVVLA